MEIFGRTVLPARSKTDHTAGDVEIFGRTVLPARSKADHTAGDVEIFGRTVLPTRSKADHTLGDVEIFGRTVLPPRVSKTMAESERLEASNRDRAFAPGLPHVGGVRGPSAAS